MGSTHYDHLRVLEAKYITISLVLQVIKNNSIRLRILLFAIKLGIQGSEEELVNLRIYWGQTPKLTFHRAEPTY
jgi:hypothetical protein